MQKNRSFSGIGGVIWPFFWHIFELRSFGGTEAENRRFWRNSLLSAEREELRRSPDGARTFRGRPLENVSKMTPIPPVLRGEAFHELRRSPDVSTAAREPSRTYPVFWLPRSSCPGLPRSSSFASFCGRKVFFKNCGAPSQLKKCQNLGPLALQQDIYIYI